MEDIRQNLPMSMTMAAFTGISWYIGVEINISLFMLFQRQRGLYFWSCALCSWGVILQPLFIILADFGIWTDFLGAVTMIYLTWFIMVVPQSWVLYSRLHLIVQNQKMLRYLRVVLLFNSVVFSVPTVVVGILAQATNVNPLLKDRNIIWDRVQLTVFFVQETILSLLYINETRKHVSLSSSLLSNSTSGQPTRSEKAKNRVLWNLINANLLVIVLDITLLGIQYGGDHLFYLQGAFKPCVYGIKLKVEFLVLNQLIDSIRSRGASTPYRSHGNGGSADHPSHVHTLKPKGVSSDPFRTKSAGHASIEQIGLDTLDQGQAASGKRSGDGVSSHSEVAILDGDEGAVRKPAEPWDGTQHGSYKWR